MNSIQFLNIEYYINELSLIFSHTLMIENVLMGRIPIHANLRKVLV